MDYFQFLNAEFLISEVFKAAITFLVPLIIAGFVWLIMLKLNSNKIRTLLKDRTLYLYYKGAQDNSEYKPVTFQKNGTIGVGRNDNESSWKVLFAKLIIISSNGEDYSKFKWDQKQGKLLHTNDPKLPSVMGQFIVPFVKES